MQLKALPVAVLAMTVSALAASADPVDPAQAIAQKFYEASEPKSSVKSVAKPVMQPVANPAVKPVVQPIANASVSVANPVAQPPPPGLDYEMDMLRQARADEQEFEKHNANADLTNVAQPLPARTPLRAVAEAPAIPAPEKATPEKTPSEQAPPQPAASEPAVPERAAPQTPNPAEPQAQESSPPLQTAIKQEQERAASSTGATALGTRATVLIVLDTGDDAAAPKPDPIICFDQQCWISNGLEAPAKPMPRSVALALKTTDDVTHDSCSGKTGCAFRDIAIQPNALVQVVEVGESRGVSDGAFTVASDTSCRKNGDDLVCQNALVTQTFRMWVVPETTAQAIGPSALEDAIANNLPDNDDGGPDDGK